MPEVGKIYKNRVHKLDFPEKSKEIEPSTEGLEWNVERIRANEVWNLGFDGTGGAVVGSLDSGVDWTHPALKKISGEDMIQIQGGNQSRRKLV